MFRMLIVEDDQDTVDMLRMNLNLHFTVRGLDPQIDAASTIAEARRLIESATRPYHAAILDFKVPADIGINAEVDVTICRLLIQQMRPPIVCHITSYREDNIVDEHLRIYHEERINSYPSFALSKRDTSYVGTIIKNLKKALYGKRILEQLNRLFGEDPQGALSRSAEAIEVTFELADLCRDIAWFWHDLDESLQSRIQRCFHINALAQPIEVSLL